MAITVVVFFRVNIPMREMIEGLKVIDNPKKGVKAVSSDRQERLTFSNSGCVLALGEPGQRLLGLQVSLREGQIPRKYAGVRCKAGLQLGGYMCPHYEDNTACSYFIRSSCGTGLKGGERVPGKGIVVWDFWVSYRPISRFPMYASVKDSVLCF